MPRRGLVSVALLATLTTSGCGGGQEVTSQALDHARTLWQRAGITSYNLEWRSSGRRQAHYRVFVRDGQVRAIYTVTPEGREVPIRPADPHFYGVEGLFDTIEDELAQRDGPRPFNQPPGTSIVMRFRPDPQLGYPRSYRRDVLGTPQRLGIDVVQLDPDPPEAIPPPSE